MTSNELRIGNLVYPIELWDGEPYSVTAENLSESIYESVDVNHEKRLVHILNGQIAPIPLTEEWLLTLGFEKIERENYKSRKWYLREDIPHAIRFNLQKATIGGQQVMSAHKNDACVQHIQYVHQLQNLYFALSGEEITVQK